MNKEEVKEKIIELNKNLINIETEIEHIQNNCNHTDYKISLHNFGQVEVIQRVCLYCKKPLGDPNVKELKNWKKYNMV